VGKKMAGQKDGEHFFCPTIFLPQNSFSLKRYVQGELSLGHQKSQAFPKKVLA